MISQTIEYALRAMVFLATRDGPEAVTSLAIALAMRVPPGYLSKVMRDLVLARLVRSLRGPNGGFALARTPASISILDIVNAVDPLERIRSCPVGNSAHPELCPLHARLDSILAQVEQEFARTSLSDVITPAVRGRCDTLTRAAQANPSSANPSAEERPIVRAAPGTKSPKPRPRPAAARKGRAPRKRPGR